MKDFVKKILLVAIFALAVINFNSVLAGIGTFFQIIFPLLLGAIMAFVLNILMTRIEKVLFPKVKNRFWQGIRRPIAIILSIVTIVAIFTGIVRIVVPELTKSVPIIAKEIPGAIDNGVKWLEENSAELPDLTEYLTELKQSWPKLVQNFSNYIKNGVSGLFTSIMGLLGAVTSGVLNFVIGLIFCIYILANKEKLAVQAGKLIDAYTSPTMAKRVRYVLSIVNECFSNFIVGQCVEAVILGALCAIGMGIFRFPYATMIGTVIGATALIPMLGAYIGAAVGAFLILTVNPIQVLFFLIFIVVLQQLEGNLIYPKVVGSSIGLPGMWVLAAVTIGGGLAGVPGMLIGVPAAASVYRLLSNDVAFRGRAIQKKVDKKEDANAVKNEPEVVKQSSSKQNTQKKRKK